MPSPPAVDSSTTRPMSLGFLGDKRVKNLAPDVSRFGGRATVWTGIDLSLFDLSCSICSRELSLILQLDTTYDSEHPRLIYVFACLNPQEKFDDQDDDSCPTRCHTFNGGWRVYRVVRRVDAASTNDTICIENSESIFDQKSRASLTDLLKVDSKGVDTQQTSLAGLAQALESLSLNNTQALNPKPKDVSKDTPSDDWVFLGSEDVCMLPCHLVVVEPADEGVEQLIRQMWTSDKVDINKLIEESGPSANEEAEADEIKSDLMAVHAQKILAVKPDQIIRYQVRGKPLWICSPVDHRNAEYILGTRSVPKCLSCGAPKCFEFQILSTLTSSLGPRSPPMDWGTAVIYVCSQDCSIMMEKRGYDVVSESVIVQTV